MVDAASLYEQVMELPVGQRHELALQILKSVGEGPGRPLSAREFQALLIERGEAYDRGDTDTVDAFEAIELARKQIQGIRSRQE